MVNIVEDWKDMESYAANASRATGRAYQVSDIETPEKKNKILLRIQVGKSGFEQEFPDRSDPVFREIQDFCTFEKFLNVSKTVPDDQFFK